MPSRPVQAAIVQHENKQFPREAPGFTADLSSLQDLWDAVHSQPNVPKDAKLVVETQNPAGGAWWQRWPSVDKLPSEENDPIKVKALRKPLPGAGATSPTPAAGKGKKKAQGAGKKGGGPPTAGKKAAERAERKRAETPPSPSPRKGGGGGGGGGAAFDAGDEDYDIVRVHLNDIDAQISAKDSKLDKVETQLMDSYDNDKKVLVLARIQDRLAATLTTLHEQRTAIVVAAIAADEDEEVDYEETWAEHMMAAIDEEDDDDIIDDFS